MQEMSYQVSRDSHLRTILSRHLRLSLFEKVILANSLMLIGMALVALWITSHSIESQHYLIDTTFIVLASLTSLLINIILLRVSFRPLFALLHTIRSVSEGNTEARSSVTHSDTEIAELGQAFNTMLDKLEETQREQAILILQAQEKERRRIALELHDEAGQNITALLIHTEVLNKGLQLLPEHEISAAVQKQLTSGLDQLTELTQRTLDTIRTLSQQLRPGVLDDLGLLAAFRWLAEDGRQRLKLSVELHIEDGEPASGLQNLPALYEIALFRIAQESLTNVARHAQAQQVCITLIQEHGQILLRIRDDGRGYDPTKQYTGLGIFGMRERATLLGGTLTIRSQPGKGTVVEATLPFVALVKEIQDA